MEVAVGRTGGEPVTPDGGHDANEETGRRVRLNVGLYVATVVLGCVAVFLLAVRISPDVPGSDLLGQRAVEIDGVDVAPDLDVSVGRGTVTKVAAAEEAEQKRTAAQLEAASTMVAAFVNFDYKDPDATIETVREMSTGDFLEQYEKGAADLEKLATQAQSTMVAEIVWAGLVAGDDDSATVIVATRGTVTNKTTEFKEEGRNYRLQVQLVRSDGRWLTNDLQYVQLG